MKLAKLETRQKLYDTLTAHDARIAIFDNGGETADRYTIYFDINQSNAYSAESYIVTCSAEPNDPQGIWQHMERHSQPMHEDQKQRITLLDLPEMVAQQIITELNTENE